MDLYVSREHRFSIGRDLRTGLPYVSIPVSNRMADYEEFYTIDEATFDRYMADPMSALDFVARCRARLEDVRLVFAPGSDRGVAG